jgi:neutral amino acid transport system permease protein
VSVEATGRGAPAPLPASARAALWLSAGIRRATARLDVGVPLPVVLAAVVGLVVLVGLVTEGPRAVGQATVNGLVSGSYFALGAVGLTLVYGTLRLVNFAHGDMLTFGAYMALLATATLGLPFGLAIPFAAVATALLGLGTEVTMWRPMRRRRAGTLQLILMAIGFAFLLRNAIIFVAGTQQRDLGVNVTDSVSFAGLRIGETELIVLVVGIAVLAAVGAMLRWTRLGKQMRALADDPELAETAGIDTRRVVIATWALSGALAGLAGVLYAASVGVFTPNLGFLILISLFAAVILGGIGNAYGALAGGLVLGLVQEWASLWIEDRWKVTIGFAVLIVVLILRPQGILGRSLGLER